MAMRVVNLQQRDYCSTAFRIRNELIQVGSSPNWARPTQLLPRCCERHETTALFRPAASMRLRRVADGGDWRAACARRWWHVQAYQRHLGPDLVLRITGAG